MRKGNLKEKKILKGNLTWKANEKLVPSLLKYKTTKSNNNNNKLIRSNSRCGCVVFVYLTVMPSPTLYSNWNPTQIGIWTRPLFALSYSCLLHLLPSLLLLLLMLLLHGIHICFCVLDITHHTHTQIHAQLLSYTCLSFTFSCVFLFLFFLLLFACGRKKKPRRFSLLFETSRSRCRRQRCCSSAVCLGQQARHRPIHLFACACCVCVWVAMQQLQHQQQQQQQHNHDDNT